MTTWEFRSKDHIKWIEARCDECHMSSKFGSPRAAVFRHCHKRRNGKPEYAPENIVSAYNRYNLPNDIGIDAPTASGNLFARTLPGEIR